MVLKSNQLHLPHGHTFFQMNVKPVKYTDTSQPFKLIISIGEAPFFPVGLRPLCIINCTYTCLCSPIPWSDLADWGPAFLYFSPSPDNDGVHVAGAQWARAECLWTRTQELGLCAVLQTQDRVRWLLVSYCCCHMWPQTQWFRTPPMSYLRVLEVRSLKRISRG